MSKNQLFALKWYALMSAVQVFLATTFTNNDAKALALASAVFFGLLTIVKALEAIAPKKD